MSSPFKDARSLDAVSGSQQNMYNALYHMLWPALKRLFFKEAAILFPCGQ